MPCLVLFTGRLSRGSCARLLGPDVCPYRSHPELHLARHPLTIPSLDSLLWPALPLLFSLCVHVNVMPHSSHLDRIQLKIVE